MKKYGVLIFIFLCGLVHLSAEENNAIEAGNLLHAAEAGTDIASEEAGGRGERSREPEIVDSKNLVADDRLFAYFQCRPPKMMADKIFAFIDPIFPNTSMKILPMMFLGLWGFPDFPGFSENTALTIFFFQEDESFESSGRNCCKNWLLCAKLRAQHSLPTVLKLQGICTENYGEWTLISPNHELIQRLLRSPELPFLLSLAQAPLSDDFRLSFCPAYFESILQIATHNGSTNPLQSVQISGNIAGDFLSGSLLISAKDREFFCRLADDLPTQDMTVETINLLRENDFSSLVVRLAPKKAERFFRECMDLCHGKFLTDSQRKSIRRADAILAEICRHCRGIYVEQSFLGVNFSETVRHILPVDRVRYPQLLRWITTLYETLPQLLNGPTDSLAVLEPFQFSSAVRGNVFSHCRIPVIEGEFSAADPDKNLAWSRRNYYALAGNCILATNSLAAMEGMIEEFCQPARKKVFSSRAAKDMTAPRMNFAAGQIADMAINVPVIDDGGSTVQGDQRSAEDGKKRPIQSQKPQPAIRSQLFLHSDRIELKFEGHGTAIGNLMQLFKRAADR